MLDINYWKSGSINDKYDKKEVNHIFSKVQPLDRKILLIDIAVYQSVFCAGKHKH